MTSMRYCVIENTSIDMKTVLDKVKEYIDGEAINDTELKHLRVLFVQAETLYGMLTDAINEGELNEDLTWSCSSTRG